MSYNMDEPVYNIVLYNLETRARCFYINTVEEKILLSAIKAVDIKMDGFAGYFIVDNSLYTKDYCINMRKELRGGNEAIFLTQNNICKYIPLDGQIIFNHIERIKLVKEYKIMKPLPEIIKFIYNFVTVITRYQFEKSRNTKGYGYNISKNISNFDLEYAINILFDLELLDKRYNISKLNRPMMEFIFKIIFPLTDFIHLNKIFETTQSGESDTSSKLFEKMNFEMQLFDINISIYIYEVISKSEYFEEFKSFFEDNKKFYVNPILRKYIKLL